MSRTVEEPTITPRKGPGNSDELEYTHPAYAQIEVSRVSGGNVTLYDSDFKHNHYMVLRVQPSRMMRHLNKDWHHSGHNPMIEVAMSESQWATLVSSLNMGGGVPCTLQRFDGKNIPSIPAPIARHDQYAGEIKEDLAEAVAEMDALDKLIEESGLSKTKAAALREKVRSARSTLTSSIPWIVESADKHMEKTVERGKQEVQGYMLGMIQRAGLEQLTGGVLPLQIEDSSDA